jgi:hypothetical protein
VPRKAKRTLSNIDFSKEGAHLALVSKEQGGPANGHDYAVVMKATNLSPEVIQKMQQVQVTLELPEFLRRFFSLYSEDAEVLARMLGYVPPETKDEWNYEDYIQSKLDSYKVLKSLHEASSINDVLNSLSEDEHLKLRNDQAMLEKAFSNSSVKDEEGESGAVTKVKDPEKETKASPSESVNKGNTMDEKVEKAQFDAVQKALDEQKEALQKALELVETFKAKEKEAIQKARFAEVKTAVKDEDKAEVLFKALSLIDSSEEFTAVVKVLADMTAQIEKSELFEEKGSAAQEESEVKESLVAKAVKANLKK